MERMAGSLARSPAEEVPQMLLHFILISKPACFSTEFLRFRIETLPVTLLDS
jgi:hypothetical protein